MTGNRVHVRLRSVRRPFVPLSCTGPYRMPYTRNGTLEPAFPSGSPALPRGRQRCSFSCSLLKKLEGLSRPSCFGAQSIRVRDFTPSSIGTD